MVLIPLDYTKYILYIGKKLTFALVFWILSQGISEEPCFAPITIETSCIIDALQTFTSKAVAVPNSIRVNVLAALAEAARLDRAIRAKGIPKITIVT